jgi:hypothetical protein
MHVLHYHGRDIGEERAVRDPALHDSALASSFASTCLQTKTSVREYSAGFQIL